MVALESPLAIHSRIWISRVGGLTLDVDKQRLQCRSERRRPLADTEQDFYDGMTAGVPARPGRARQLRRV
jgi:hypothetical protein